MKRDIIVVGLGAAAAGVLSSPVARTSRVTVIHDPCSQPVTAGLPILVSRPELCRAAAAGGTRVADAPIVHLVDSEDGRRSVRLPLGATLMRSDDLYAAIHRMARRSAVELIEGTVVQVRPELGLVTLAPGPSGVLELEAELVIWCAGSAAGVFPAEVPARTIYWRQTEPTGASQLSVTLSSGPASDSEGGPIVRQRLTSALGGFELVTGPRPEGGAWNESSLPMELTLESVTNGRLILTGAAIGCASPLTAMGTSAAFATGLAAGAAAAASPRPSERFKASVRRDLGFSSRRIGSADRRLDLAAHSIAGVARQSTPLRSRVGSVLLGYADGLAHASAEIALGTWDRRKNDLRDAARGAVLEVLSRVWVGPIPTAVESRGSAEPRLSDFAIALSLSEHVAPQLLIDTASSIDLVMAGMGLMGPAVSGQHQALSTSRPDWLRISSILAMDLAFAEAARHAARVGSWYLELLAGWALDLLRTRLQVIHGDRPPLALYEKLFEFPFRVATASGWNPGLDLGSLIGFSRAMAAEYLAAETQLTTTHGLGRIGLPLQDLQGLGLLGAPAAAGSIEALERQVTELFELASDASQLTPSQERAISELRRVCREGGVSWA